MKRISFFLSIGLSTVLIVNLSACRKDKIPVAPLSVECPDTIRFSTQISPMIQNYCVSCHASGAGGYTLGDYTSISNNADIILKSLRGDGVLLMPDGGPALADSLIQQFTCWINQGKLNN